MRGEIGMDVVVIGAVAAGLSAAGKAKRTDPQARVLVFGREEHVSYAACGLPYYIGGLIDHHQQLFARKPEHFASQGIEVNVGHEVVEIQPRHRQVLVQSPQGRREKVSYDKLIIATGARHVVPPLPGSDLENVFTVATIPHAEKIRTALENKAQRAVIVGAGFIGLEMAEALHMRGLEVTVLQRSGEVAGTVDADMGALVRQHLLEHGVQVHTQVQVHELYGTDVVQGVRTDQGDIPCDLVIMATGVRPNSGLARDAGLHLGVKGAISVNRRMETSHPDIFAAGDCATAWHHLYQDSTYIPLGTTANKQGRVAGENAVGGKAVFSGIVGTAIMKVLDLSVGRTGLNTREAETLGKSLLSVRVNVSHRAVYYPQPGKGTVKLLFSEDGIVWGAQLVGSDSFAKRVDVFAAAIQFRCTLEELAGLDLSYSPPYSAVWDPVLVAANVALGKLK